LAEHSAAMSSTWLPRRLGPARGPPVASSDTDMGIAELLRENTRSMGLVPGSTKTRARSSFPRDTHASHRHAPDSGARADWELRCIRSRANARAGWSPSTARAGRRRFSASDLAAVSPVDLQPHPAVVLRHRCPSGRTASHIIRCMPATARVQRVEQLPAPSSRPSRGLWHPTRSRSARPAGPDLLDDACHQLAVSSFTHRAGPARTPTPPTTCVRPRRHDPGAADRQIGRPDPRHIHACPASARANKCRLAFPVRPPIPNVGSREHGRRVLSR